MRHMGLGKDLRAVPVHREAVGANIGIAGQREAHRVVLAGGGGDILLEESTPKNRSIITEGSAERLELHGSTGSTPSGKVSGLEASVYGSNWSGILRQRALRLSCGNLGRLVCSGDVDREGGGDAVSE